MKGRGLILLLTGLLAGYGCSHNPDETDTSWMEEDLAPARVLSCQYQGKKYQSGAVFSAGDDCNECQCNPSGRVRCTVKNCKEDEISLKVRQ